MWSQILAIAQAQLRISRNHLPRTSAGTFLLWLLMAFWYGIFSAAGVSLALAIPLVKPETLTHWFGPGLFGVFIFWQSVPLFTLSSGWSLELRKIRIYPIPDSALFGIETLLRISSAPEMMLVLAGALVGLLRRSSVSHSLGWFLPFTLIVFVAFNLFLQLGIRDLLLRSFERSRMREMVGVVAVLIGVLPQLLLRTSLGMRAKPYFVGLGNNSFMPWQQSAALASGAFDLREGIMLLLWTLAAFWFARRTFTRSLRADDIFFAAPPLSGQSSGVARRGLFALTGKLFRDPFASLVEKEVRSLLRTPRFRVAFTTSCLLGFLVFVPAYFDSGGSDPTRGFFAKHMFPIINLYGLLILSDTLLINSFGLDRSAAQVYFAAPVGFRAVLQAKNFAAVLFVLLQNLVIGLLTGLIRTPRSGLGFGAGFCVSAVVTIFLLTVGNFTSIAGARPVDPRETFKKQSGARLQLWMMGATFGMFLLVGFAFLARYAMQGDYAFYTVLAAEFAIGVMLYFIGIQSAVERGIRDKEQFVEALSRSGSPLGLG